MWATKSPATKSPATKSPAPGSGSPAGWSAPANSSAEDWQRARNTYIQYVSDDALTKFDGRAYASLIAKYAGHGDVVLPSSDLPDDVSAFMSPSVAWKYQTATPEADGCPPAAAGGLRAVRVYASDSAYGKDNDMYDYPESVTLAGAIEVAGLAFSDGTRLSWRPHVEPPERARLVAPDGSVRPVDRAHLEVCVFGTPRLVQYFSPGGARTPFPQRRVVAVGGTLLRVLKTLAGSVFSGKPNPFEFAGLQRSYAANRAAPYYEVARKIPKGTWTPQRARLQQKMHDVLGKRGHMDEWAIGSYPDGS